MSSQLNVDIIATSTAATLTLPAVAATSLTLTTDLAVADGGLGVSTLADGGLVIGNAAAAVEVVAAGATTEILVGGGASTAPVWTTATGSGAPVRATSPALTTPNIGTPSAGVLTSCTGYPGTSLTVIDAKGDLIVGTASDTAAKLTVGSNGTVPMADSTATAGIAYRAALGKAIYGLVQSNDGGDPTNDIAISAGGAMDSTNAYWMTLSSAITKRLDASWVVGTAQGGLDGTESVAGTPDTSTWYYIWLIARSGTGVVDVLFSESATSPTMPASYDFKRLIGAVFNNSGANLDLFTAYETEGGGLEVMWTTPTLDINLADTLTTARRTDAVHAPLAFSTIAHLNVAANDASGGSFVFIQCPDQTDSAPSVTVAPIYNLGTGDGTVANQSFGGQYHIRTSSAGLIASRASVATMDLYIVSTMGFMWARRN